MRNVLLLVHLWIICLVTIKCIWNAAIVVSYSEHCSSKHPSRWVLRRPSNGIGSHWPLVYFTHKNLEQLQSIQRGTRIGTSNFAASSSDRRSSRPVERDVSELSFGHIVTHFNIHNADSMNDVLVSANDSLCKALHNMNVRQEVGFIRFLLQYHAYEAILTFVKRYSGRSESVYTAAIKALSKCNNKYRQQCFSVLNEMDRFQIMPSVFTFTALFQASADWDEAAQLSIRLKQSYPTVVWTAPVWESAIYACASTRNTTHGSRVESLKSSEIFYCDMISTIGPTERGVLAILRVYAVHHGAVSNAIELLNSILFSDSFQITARIWGALLEVCAATKDNVSALEILNIMTNRGIHPNVRHCTSCLKAASAAGNIKQAIDFLYYMAGMKNIDGEMFGHVKVASPDMVAIRTVLCACAQSSSYSEAYQVLSYLRDGLFGDHLQANEQIYNLVLDTCSNSEDAKSLVREMRLSRRNRFGAIPPSMLTYTKAMAVCRKTRDVQSAKFLLDSAMNDGIIPDLFMFSASIWTAARAHDIKAALHFRSEMDRLRCYPNVVALNGIMAAFLSQQRIDEAMSVYEEIIDKGLTPTFTTYDQLAQAARNLTDTDEKLNLLDRIYRSMRSECCQMDTCGPVLEAFITALGLTGRFKDARDAFESIKGPPNTACLHAILKVCSNVVPPAWEDALLFLNSGAATSPRALDQATLSLAMLVCCKANKWSEGLELLRLHGSSRTSVVAVNALIAACGRKGRPDMSMEVLNGMSQLGLNPDRYSYRNAIIACNQAAHSERRVRLKSGVELNKGTLSFEWWEAALSLLRRMKEDGLEPDNQTYSSAISACEAAGEWQLALGVLQSMMDESDGDLNIYCFNAAIAACEKAGAWVEALDIYMRMQQIESLQPTKVTIGSLILSLDKAGQKELATSIYEEARCSEIIASPWRMTRSLSGTSIRALDLHTYSAAMAKAAIRVYFESLTRGQYDSVDHDLVLITGKGIRSENEPVLMPVALALLKTEYGILGRVDPDNAGRVVVAAETLVEFIEKRR